MSCQSQLIDKKAKEISKLLMSTHHQQKVEEAAVFWWKNLGQFPSDKIANTFGVNHEILTLEIQRQMGIKFDMKIKNQAPIVEVHWTKDALNKAYPKGKPIFNSDYTLELFYQIKYG